ncbi:MAG: NAD-dependent epimerase/dehydratase family protein [Myxococcota bacterium]
MTHLVTGGCGFLGAALCRSLSSDGISVRSLDNHARGRAARLRGVEGVELQTGDVRDLATVRESARGASVIWHLAAINGTRNFYERPGDVLEVGLKGALNVVDVAVELGAQRLVLFSSSEVYQRAAQIPTPEDVPMVVPDPTNPRYSYGGGKLASELIALHIGQSRGLDVVIVRPHNVYGPDMGHDHVIPELTTRLVRAAEASKGAEVTLSIEGDGSETRAFCHVDDAIAGARLAQERGEPGGIYHLGTEEEIRIADLAHRIGDALNLKVTLATTPLRAGSTPRRCPSIERLRGLGYVPATPLEAGLAPVVRWYADHVRGV